MTHYENFLNFIPGTIFYTIVDNWVCNVKFIAVQNITYAIFVKGIEAFEIHISEFNKNYFISEVDAFKYLEVYLKRVLCDVKKEITKYE